MALISSNKITSTQLLIPMSLMVFTMVLLFAFQISQIMHDRDNLNQTLGHLDAPLAESEKINKQFGGLVQGTQKLAQEGNKTAKDFVGRLKKIGVIVDRPQGQVPRVDDVPPPPPSPVKP
ncbi:MAG TPA: hypothetical protein DD400_01470 [Rhodospirillaceae bacterium]|nr:hypothetical protein [Rhodospirillaceae bacterium]